MSSKATLPTCPKCGAPIPIEAPQGLCPRCVLLGASTATEQGIPATATSEIPSLERIAKAFPQFEVLELIGRGGMGFVFKARQPQLDRFVALKLLPDTFAKDPQFAERFNLEGRVLAKLNHPNIVSVYDFGQAEGFCYLAMEYVDGVNLRQAMRAGRFSPAEALSLVPKVCEALQYAHDQGVLHRDIKPENILLDSKGRVKIADFGIAKLVGDDQPNITLTNTGASLGTPHYMAPEQFEKPTTVDHRADIYSLGVVFYELLTGELPIGRFAAPSSMTPVNKTVDEVVFRTLEKDRERRFQSAGEMRTQVEHLGAGANAEASPVQPEASNPARRPEPILNRILQVVLSVVLLLCLVAFLSFEQRDITYQGQPRAYVRVGWLNPWLVVNEMQSTGALRTSLNFAAGSILFAFGAFASGWRLVSMRRRARYETEASPSRGEERALSQWSIYGALAVGLSLPGPLSVIVGLMTGQAGFKPSDLWITLGSLALPGLGGTLLGWLGLNEIRESRGRVKGLPLAMFATLFWPLTLLGALTIGLPMFLLLPSGESTAANNFGRILVLILPAAVIAFGFWSIHATARWAGTQPAAPQQRGVLKWVFIVVLLIGMGVVLVTNPGSQRNAVPPTQPVSQQQALQSQPMRDVEHWSPQLAPGEKPRPSDILQEAHQLASAGRYDEALERQIWYHNHALEFDRSQFGVRLSFALSYWMELGRLYPRALATLQEIGARGAARFAKGEGDFALFMEVSAINGYLGKEEATLALFKSILARDARLAGQCYVVVQDLLVDKGEYALCERFIPNVRKQFETLRVQWQNTLSDRNLQGDRESLRQHAQKTFIKNTRHLIEILVGVERVSEAEEIRDLAVAALNVPEFQSAVVDAEQRVDKKDAAVRAFGPVQEIVLPESTAMDLLTGRTKLVPESLSRLKSSPEKPVGICDWLQRQGLDIAYLGRGEFYNSGQDMKVLTREEWNDFSPAQLDASLRPIGKEVGGTFEDKVPFAFTYGFKTRASTLGLLQIADFPKTQDSVKLRFKLAPSPSPKQP